MPEVYAWPPVRIAAHGSGLSRPGGTSFDLRGVGYYSQAQKAREMYRVSVLALGSERDGSGYIDMLKRQLDGKPPLVRISPLPPLWLGALRGLQGKRGAEELRWWADGRTLDWDLVWTSGNVISAVSAADGNWNGIRCTGLPPSMPVAFPGELVRAKTGEVARVLKREISDPEGTATIRLDAFIPSGEVLIGARDSLVMWIDVWPTTMLSFGAQTIDLTMHQVFAEDYADAFTEVNPWS